MPLKATGLTSRTKNRSRESEKGKGGDKKRRLLSLALGKPEGYLEAVALIFFIDVIQKSLEVFFGFISFSGFSGFSSHYGVLNNLISGTNYNIAGDIKPEGEIYGRRNMQSDTLNQSRYRTGGAYAGESFP
jgi:hypothetical protein